MDDPYQYPGTNVLINHLGIKDQKLLDQRERQLADVRCEFDMPKGDFNLEHLQAIHRHIFQDIYPWAGELRTVEINKRGDQFIPSHLIQNGMRDVHKRLVQMDFLKGLKKSDFARNAGEIIGDVNHIHPFREGNGRAQMQYLKQLAMQAGHLFRISSVQPEQWIEASREAHLGNYQLMASIIDRSSLDCRKTKNLTAKQDQRKGRKM